jgi:DNA-binding NarL/FixJ family response regulator
MQINRLFPLPQQPRSGRVEAAPRSRGAPTAIRVVIGDADSEYRHMLRSSFAADSRIDLVGETDDGEHALLLLRWLRPDIAILDEDLPSFGGAAIARILRSELPDTRVVVMERAAPATHA